MKIEKWDKSIQEKIKKEITAKPVSFMKRDNAKVEKIRNLCKLSTQCKELYTPMLEAYDKGDMELPDLLVQFAMMEMKRKTKNFSYKNCKDESKNNKDQEAKEKDQR